MTKIQRDVIAYLVIVTFCIVMLVWAIPAYTPAYPGYGASAALVPNVAVGVMLFMACLALITTGIAKYRKKPMAASETTFPDDANESGFTQVGRINLSHLFGIMLPSLLFIIAIEYVSYLISAFVYLMILQFVIGSRRWLQSVVVAVSLTAVLYVVMRYGFGVPVPGPQLF